MSATIEQLEPSANGTGNQVTAGGLGFDARASSVDDLLYASLSRQILSETLGGGKFGFPPCVAGGSAHLGLRWTHRRDGKSPRLRRRCEPGSWQ